MNIVFMRSMCCCKTNVIASEGYIEKELGLAIAPPKNWRPEIVPGSNMFIEILRMPVIKFDLSSQLPSLRRIKD